METKLTPEQEADMLADLLAADDFKAQAAVYKKYGQTRKAKEAKAANFASVEGSMKIRFQGAKQMVAALPWTGQPYFPVWVRMLSPLGKVISYSLLGILWCLLRFLSYRAKRWAKD